MAKKKRPESKGIELTICEYLVALFLLLLPIDTKDKKWETSYAENQRYCTGL